MSRFGRLFEKFRPARTAENPTSPIDARWVVAGLGNPGEQYRRARHNLGFMVADRLATRAGVDLNRRKFNGLYSEIHLEDTAAIVVKPQTFYNRSGECVGSLIRYFKVPVERLIVVHDEMDLPVGQIRIKRGGSDAGNRGVRSVAESLDDPDFIRVRVGVGHPEGAGDSINYLLRPLNAAEMSEFESIFDRAADAVVATIRDGLERAMNLHNRRA